MTEMKGGKKFSGAYGGKKYSNEGERRKGEAEAKRQKMNKRKLTPSEQARSDKNKAARSKKN